MRRSSFSFAVTTLAGSSIKNIPPVIDSHHIESKYRRKFMISSATAGILEPLAQAERIIWQKRILNYKLTTPPVFIIGFWRSGTTLLHNLLCQDPAAAYTTTFQTVFPNLVLTQSWWLKPLINHLVPAQRPYDNISMDMDFPQEEDFGLMNIQPSTIYKFFLFPTDFDRIIEEELFTGNLNPNLLTQWKEAYRGMIAKAIFNTGGTRYIGKNPCHLTRIGLLTEMFPDAKFIFIHRHPYYVIESLYHFILSVFPGVQLQDVPPGFSREKVVNLYKKCVDEYFCNRDKIQSSNLIELKMDDFMEDIPWHLKAIYEKFGLGDFNKVSSVINQYLDQNPAPKREPKPPTPETTGLVDRYASDIMEKLGYSGQTAIVSASTKPEKLFQFVSGKKIQKVVQN
jgi:hypothetical protein